MKKRSHMCCLHCLLYCQMIFAVCGYAQHKTGLPQQNWPAGQLAKYFKIEGRFVTVEGKQYPTVYPALRENPQDTFALFMKRYHRRFEYVLQNETTFNDLAVWYPDSARINAVYAGRLAENVVFLKHLKELLQPLVTMPVSVPRISYSGKELMLVASRFFLCDRVRPDTTVSWHICIGLNGVKEADWNRDYTLLEAFCFEAIFDKMFSNNPDDRRFMARFLEAVEESGKRRRQGMTDTEQFLEQVKTDVFQAMQADETLKKHLLAYYHLHAAGLPFKIIPD